MSGEGGQRFFNVAYSIGAAIVILGALFKILHVKGGDTLLAVGMGTEVLMFILTAFERPYNESSKRTGSQGEFNGGSSPYPVAVQDEMEGTILAQPSSEPLDSIADFDNSDERVDGQILAQPVSAPIDETASPIAMRGSSPTMHSSVVNPIPTEIAAKMEESVRSIDENMQHYIAQMTDLNRNIAGLNTIYELQLKTASSQLSSLEFAGKSMTEMHKMYEGSAERSQVFQEEAAKLTENMKKLNEVYENMLRAMNVQNKV